MVGEEIQWDPTLYKWEQMAMILRDRIRTGAYPVGYILSEVQIGVEFNAARMTIRKVMQVLRDEGLIITKPGKGSIVVAQGDVLS